tara:strand:- start:17993 stop:18904 length:912 start_codon:yes stop_codon:yes gene_type:complete
MATIINSGYCPTNNNEVIGTGLQHCPVNIQDIRTIGLVKRGTDFGTSDNPDDMNLAYEQQLQVDGKLIILNGIFDVVDNGAEDSTEQNPSTGLTKSTLKNPYSYTINFENDLAFNKALNYLDSYDQWDIVMWDREGNKFFTQSVAGLLKGLAVGRFTVGMYKLANGTTTAKQSVTFELKYRDEFDKRISWIIANELDYNAQEDLDGINQMLVDVTAPADTDTTVLFNVTDITKGVPNVVFTASDVVVKVNGVADAGALVSNGNGSYTKTVAALSTSDVVTVQIEPKVVGSRVYQSALVSTITT